MHVLVRATYEVAIGTTLFFGMTKVYERYIGQSETEKRIASLEAKMTDHEVRITQAEDAIETNADASEAILEMINALDPQHHAA